MLNERLGRAEAFPLSQSPVAEFSSRPVPHFARSGRGTCVDRSLGIPQLVLHLEQFGIRKHSHNVFIGRKRPRRGDDCIDRCNEQLGG